MADSLRVLYIAGDGRSGSTLLERMLGQVNGFVAVGELRHIWRRGFIENQLCGCGAPFRSCTFWSKVLDLSFSGANSIVPEEVLALQEDVEHSRHIGMMYLASASSIQGAKREEYKSILLRLYQAIDQISGHQTIINSSKEASSIYLLSTVPGIDISVVHLVRDSRAVAFSWMRRKVRPEIVDRTVYMPTYRPSPAAWNWLVNRNMLSEAARFVANRYVRIRYEDLVSNPRQVMERVLAAVGMGEPPLEFIQGNVVHLDQDNHTVAGNPMRFQRGPVTLKLDDEWKSEMGEREKRLVTAITWPLLLRYGYGLAGRADGSKPVTAGEL